MKALIALLPALLIARAFAADVPTPAEGSAQPAAKTHRYVVERTFPRGALDGLDAATKAKVNANNASVGVKWETSYANSDKTKTYCIYDGPTEAAIRQAAKLNALPVDSVTEVPVDLDPGAKEHAEAVASTEHRYLIERTFKPGALDGLDAPATAKVNATNAKFGVHWVTSYANGGKTKTYCIYKAPNEAAVRDAATANGIPVDSVTEVPVTLSAK